MKAYTVIATDRAGKTRIEHFAGGEKEAVIWAKLFYSETYWTLRVVDPQGRVVFDRLRITTIE